MKTFLINSKKQGGPFGIFNAENIEDALVWITKNEIEVSPDEITEWDTQKPDYAHFIETIDIEVSDKLYTKIMEKNGQTI